MMVSATSLCVDRWTCRRSPTPICSATSVSRLGCCDCISHGTTIAVAGTAVRRSQGPCLCSSDSDESAL